MDINISIGIRIRALRKQRKWSQLRLAEETDLNIDTIGKIERGVSSPTIETLDQVAYALEITLPELFRFEESADTEREEIMSTLIASASRMDTRTLTVAVKQLQDLAALSKTKR